MLASLKSTSLFPALVSAVPGLRMGSGYPWCSSRHDTEEALAFRADGQLERGMRLRVSLAWPATLDDQCKLRLAFEGTVLRTGGNLVVQAIRRPEFRTAGKIAAGRQELLNAAEDI